MCKISPHKIAQWAEKGFKVDDLSEKEIEYLNDGGLKEVYTIRDNLKKDIPPLTSEKIDSLVDRFFPKKFAFTRYNEYESNGLVHCMVSFVPAVTIKCNPPYVKEKKDSAWIKFRPGKAPKNKEELEGRLGMSILSWE